MFIAGKLSAGVNDTGDTLSTVALLPALNNADVIDNGNYAFCPEFDFMKLAIKLSAVPAIINLQ